MHINCCDIDLALCDLNNADLALFCGLIADILGLNENVDMLKFIKRDMLLQFCSLHLDELLNKISKYAY